MALGLTQPLTEVSTRNISWGVKAASAQGWQPYHLHVPIVLKSGSFNLLEPSGPVQVCNGIAVPFTVHGRTAQCTYQWCFLESQHELLVNGKFLDSHIGVTEGSVLLGCCILLLGVRFLMFWRIVEPSILSALWSIKAWETTHTHTHPPNKMVSHPRRPNSSLFGNVWHFNTDWEYFPPLFLANFCTCA